MTQSVDLAVARRFLAIRHLLAPPRSLPASAESVMSVVDRLGSLQFDPLEVAGRNHDLVLAARIDGYRRELTDELLYGRRLLFEAYNKSLNLLPTRELPYYRISWDTMGSGRSADLLARHADVAERLTSVIEAEGPKSSADFERLPAVDWWWGPTAGVRAVLEALWVSGRLSLARREGNRRYYDLTERIYPPDLLQIRVPEREQRRHKLMSRFRAHGLVGASASGEVWLGVGSGELRKELIAELVDRDDIVPVAVEGLKGVRYVVADELPLLAQAEREVQAESSGGESRPGDGPPGCAFIAPLDPMLWDRRLLSPLWGFDYIWEVYTPAHKRRWGYYVLPVLFGDRIVGRIEPRIDRTAKAIRIIGLEWESHFRPLETPGFPAAFGDALAAYLVFAGADHVIPPSDGTDRPLFEAVSRKVRVASSDLRRPGKRGAPVAASVVAARR